ncbi:MAG: hypothetical protein D6E12_01510 [Desulfovibrio sp.]|nr:MAG: hypothetical protein D6E12_01510 [Desulfovibrio sp.]
MHTTVSKLTGVLALLLLTTLAASPALAGARVVFLHHSTGGGVYWDGDVEGYIASRAPDIQIEERSYPDSPYDWENYPYDYWNLWINGACDSGNPNIECMDSLARNYDVIIFKHCFPGAYVEPDYGPGDVSSPDKTMANYQAQYRALRDLMDSYPDTKFIVWTLAPLHRQATDRDASARAAQFVDWVNHGFLTEDGQGHPNIFIFDFWSIVTETNPNPAQGEVNTLRYEFEQNHSDSDSHPNYQANQAAGPQFGQFIIDVVNQ